MNSEENDVSSAEGIEPEPSPLPMGARSEEHDASPTDIDLTLKRLDKWVKTIGIVGAILAPILTASSIINVVRQNRLVAMQEELVRLQGEEHAEKRHVNIAVELRAANALTANNIVVFATLTNKSSRNLDIAMIGIRIWRHDWKSRNTLQDSPHQLIYSENIVADCSPEICPQKTSNSLLRTGYPISLAPGESQADSYGPYPISKADWQRGVWLEALLRPVQQNEGVCSITGPSSVTGGFPDFCEESIKDQKDCNDRSSCLFFNTPALPYTPGKQ